MPIFSPKDSTFKIVKLNNVIVLCDSATRSQNLPIETIKLTTGDSQNPFRNIGDISNVINLDGQSLIREGDFVGNDISTIYSQCGGNFHVSDVPSLALVLLFNDDNNDFETQIHKEFQTTSFNLDQFQKPIIDKVKLTLNESGLNCSLSLKGNIDKNNSDNNNSYGYIDLDYMSSIDTGNICKIVQPMRTASFYDLGVILEHKQDVPNPIINAFKSFDISVEYFWKTIEYIGKPQTELYIFNGGAIKWNFETNFKFPIVHSAIDGETTFTYANINYAVNPQKSGEFNSRLISDLNNVYMTTCDNIGSTNDFSSLGTSRLVQLMNNCLHQVVIPDFGGQTGHLNDKNPKDGVRLTTNIEINHKFPLSTLKVSGERLLS